MPNAKCGIFRQWLSIGSTISRTIHAMEHETTTQLDVSIRAVKRFILKILYDKVQKTCGVQQLNTRQIIYRRQRSWNLFVWLQNGILQIHITSDEASYLGTIYGRRSVCCLRKGYDDRHKLNAVQRDAFVASFMAWSSLCVLQRYNWTENHWQRLKSQLKVLCWENLSKEAKYMTSVS